MRAGFSDRFALIAFAYSGTCETPNAMLSARREYLGIVARFSERNPIVQRRRWHLDVVAIAPLLDRATPRLAFETPERSRTIRGIDRTEGRIANRADIARSFPPSAGPFLAFGTRDDH